MANGAVEGLVGFARPNFMVPCCAVRNGMRSISGSKINAANGRRLSCEGTARVSDNGRSRDLAVMPTLPAARFDACDQATGQVSSQAVVRTKTDDYSGPVA